MVNNHISRFQSTSYKAYVIGSTLWLVSLAGTVFAADTVQTQNPSQIKSASGGKIHVSAQEAPTAQPAPATSSAAATNTSTAAINVAASGATTKQDKKAEESQGMQIKRMQDEIAILKLRIDLETKRKELSKLTDSDSDSPSLNAKLPPGVNSGSDPKQTQPNTPVASKKVKTATNQKAISLNSVELPTYDSVDGIDGRNTVSLWMPDGTNQKMKVGDGGPGWTISSISSNRVTVQIGKISSELRFQEAPQTNNSGLNPTLNQALPPAYR